MVEPCKLQDKYFCQHCIKHVKASSVTNDDDDDAAKEPSPEDAEKPEIKYLEIIKQAPNNPIIDTDLQEKIKKEFTLEYEIQYEVLAKKDLLSDAEKVAIQIEIGNTYKNIDPKSANKGNSGGGLYNKSFEHDWMCYIKMADSKLDKYMPFLIQKVAFRLHQSRRIQGTDNMSKKTQKLEIA